MTERPTTTTARFVTLRTRTAGDHVATIGQVIGPRGRVLYEGIERPYGFIGSALNDARLWAVAHCYQIAQDGEEG